MQKSIQFSAVAFLCVLIYSGCSYDPGPNSLGPGKTIPAKPGSTYTFKNVQTDTTGKAIDSTTFYTRDSVVATGKDTLGKANVTDIANVDTTYGFVISHTYLNFESNGDLSVYVGGNGSSFGGVTLPDWRTYPMQTHTTVGMKVADTTITFPGIPLPIPLKAFDSMFYVNSGVYTVGTASIPVFNMKESLTYDATILFSMVTTSTVRHISFAPSLGYIISDITDPTKSPVGAIPSFGGLEVTLVSYKLK